MRRTVLQLIASVSSLRRGLFVLSLLAALLTALPALAEELKLGVIHSNDHHGHLLPFRHNGEEGWGGMARRRVAIQSTRADTDYYWLLLDAGDVFQGTPVSNMLTGFLDLECMNQMGYDAMVLGNHEFDFGYELIRGRMQDANFPILCSNVIDRERGTAVARPYVVLRRGDYRIGIIGATTETLTGETHPKIKDSVEVYPAAPVVKSLAQYLRASGCEIVIALTHQGYQRDLELAAFAPELDLIVGGHSHTELTEPTKVGNVVVTQAGEWGKALGVLRLSFEREGKDERFELVSLENEYKPMSPELPEDDGLKAFIADYNQRFEAEMARVVATATMDFDDSDMRTAENALASMVADALRSQTGADVALFNGGNFRSGLAAGPVSFGELYEVLPYDNFLMKVNVSGAKLREMLEYAGSQYGDGGFPQVSGMKVIYLDGKLIGCWIGSDLPTEFVTVVTPTGVKLALPKLIHSADNPGWTVVVDPDDKITFKPYAEYSYAPLDDSKQYSVLLTDFLATGGDGFPLSEDPYGPGFTGLEQRATFALWASTQRELSYATDGRVVFEWVDVTAPTP